MMERPIINTKNLYQIFFKKNLIDLSTCDPRTPTKTSNKPNLCLSPMSKSIYNSASPRSKPYVLRDLAANNKAIETLESKHDTLDPDYEEKMENNGLGFYMENFLSVYGFCPACGQQMLKKYAHSNVPVVDLVCTNYEYHLEKNLCFLYQVKISLTNTYFNLQKQTIVVGSKHFGEPAHLHKGSEDIAEKIVVPGYICIKLNQHPTDIQTYTIDHRNSFVLVPDYNNMSDEYFYQYTNTKSIYGKDVITWNTSMVSTLPLNRVIKINKIVHEIFSEKEIVNPYASLTD